MRLGEISRLINTRGLRHYTLNGPRDRSRSTWLPASHSAWAGPDLLRRLARDLEAYDVFLCGPGPWMAAVEADLREAGVPGERVHSEAFAV